MDFGGYVLLNSGITWYLLSRGSLWVHPFRVSMILQVSAVGRSEPKLGYKPDITINQ